MEVMQGFRWIEGGVVGAAPMQQSGRRMGQVSSPDEVICPDGAIRVNNFAFPLGPLGSYFIPPSHRMSRTCAIALAGLPPIERSLIEGALAQAAASLIPGAFIEADPTRADLIIANADDADTMTSIRTLALAGRVVLLGRSDHGTGWPLVARPLRLQALVEVARRQLEAPGGGAEISPPVAREGGWFRGFGEQQPAFSDTQPFAPDLEDGFAQTRQMEPFWPAPKPVAVPPVPPASQNPPEEFQKTRQFSPSVPSVAPSDWESEVAEWESARSDPPAVAVASVPSSPSPVATAVPMAPEPDPAADHADTVPDVLAGVDRVLLVGLPGPAPEGLTRLLEAEGFPVDFAASPQVMTERLARNVYQYVVLIEVSLGTQAIRLCRHIQRHPGRSSPHVRLLIVASHNGLLDRARAWLAGCHAWLPIPLNPSRLLGYLNANRSGEKSAA